MSASPITWRKLRLSRQDRALSPRSLGIDGTTKQPRNSAPVGDRTTATQVGIRNTDTRRILDGRPRWAGAVGGDKLLEGPGPKEPLDRRSGHHSSGAEPIDADPPPRAAGQGPDQDRG